MRGANEETLPQRRWDIDWLRILAVVGLLVPYHTYRVFDIWEDWYVKNDELSAVLNPFLYLGDAVGMQLLFLLAGSATWFALPINLSKRKKLYQKSNGEFISAN